MRIFRLHPLLPIMLLAALLSGSIAGCMRQASDSKSAKTATGSMKIEVMVGAQNNLPADPDQDVIKNKIEQALGIQLKITALVGEENYRNQRTLRLASNNSADLFYVDRRDMIKLSQEGSLLELTPYLDQLGSVTKLAGEEAMAAGNVKGKVFGIPKVSPAPQFTLWMRQDWLEQVGLKVPETLDELMQVMKAFREKDPDGNGRPDTYGFTGNPNFNAFDPLFGAFGTTYPGKLYRKEGKLLNSIYDPQMKDALAYLSDMVKEDVVDPDFLANTKGQHKDKAYQGQVGLLFYNWPLIVNSGAVKEIAAYNPKARWVQGAAPIGPGGQFNGYDDVGARSILVFPATLKKEPEKLKKIFQLIEYLTSEAGTRLVLYGQEGIHYTVEGGRIIPTDKINDVSYSHLYQLLGRDEMTYLQTKFPTAEPYFSFAIKQPRIKVYDSFVELPDEYNAAEANRFILQETFKFIYGKRPLSEYDDFVRTLESKYNYRRYIDAAEKQLREQGMLK